MKDLEDKIQAAQKVLAKTIYDNLSDVPIDISIPGAGAAFVCLLSKMTNDRKVARELFEALLDAALQPDGSMTFPADKET